jgi:hypothetical protein
MADRKAAMAARLAAGARLAPIAARLAATNQSIKGFDA